MTGLWPRTRMRKPMVGYWVAEVIYPVSRVATGQGRGAQCDSGRIRMGEVGDGKTKKEEAGTLYQDVDRQGEEDRRGIGDGGKNEVWVELVVWFRDADRQEKWPTGGRPDGRRMR